MADYYIELDSPEDGPALQEFCKSVGIPRWADMPPRKGKFWTIKNRILILSDIKKQNQKYSTFEELKLELSSMEKFSVKIPNPEISEAIQKIAFKSGWDWGIRENRVKFTNEFKLYFDKTEATMYYSALDKEYPEISLVKVIELLSVPLKPLIIVNGYKAEYTKDTVKFGCMTVTKKEVQAVVDRIKIGKLMVGTSPVFVHIDAKQVTVNDKIVTFDEVDKILAGFEQ